MGTKKLPEWIVLSCSKIEPVGSRVTCLPAPTDTDQDWLCLLMSNMDGEGFDNAMHEDGWIIDGYLSGDRLFVSYRKGEDNCIVTSFVDFFDKFMVATKLAKQFNLMKKEDRVALFEEIVHKKPKKENNLFSKHVWTTMLTPGQMMIADEGVSSPFMGPWTGGITPI